jgi:hypothetical protein
MIKKSFNPWHDSPSLSALSSEGSYERCPPKRRSVMKNTRLSSILSSSFIACALAIGSLASTQSASAQTGTTLAQVEIPFSFQMSNQTLPAGTYRIDLENNHLVLLRGPDKASGFLMMHSAIKAHAADHGTVVFDRYAGKYYLRQIWTAGTTNGLECPKSRAESNAVVAQNKPAATSVEVAFNSIPLK